MDDQKDDVPLTTNGTQDDVDAKGESGLDAVDTRGIAGAMGGRAVSTALTSDEFMADSYNMNHKKRGKAVVFNNKKFHPSTLMGQRDGTDVDRDNLFSIWTDMGFDVIVKNDCTSTEMESFLTKVALEDHSDEDCFACAILSHGDEGYVYGTDGRIAMERLVAPFKGDKCQSLATKPKIFIVQACRGDKLDGGVDVTDAKGSREEDMDTLEIRRIPTEANFLMAYSVVPGFYAWRNSAHGSWFIQALCEVFRDNWKRMDLLTMMTRVCKKVAYDFESNAAADFMRRKKQIPCITSMLTRDVYFPPKK